MPLCYIGRMSLNDQSIDIVLDLQGLMCPMPLLKAKKALKKDKQKMSAKMRKLRVR